MFLSSEIHHDVAPYLWFDCVLTNFLLKQEVRLTLCWSAWLTRTRANRYPRYVTTALNLKLRPFTLTVEANSVQRQNQGIFQYWTAPSWYNTSRHIIATLYKRNNVWEDVQPKTQQQTFFTANKLLLEHEPRLQGWHMQKSALKQRYNSNSLMKWERRRKKTISSQGNLGNGTISNSWINEPEQNREHSSAKLLYNSANSMSGKNKDNEEWTKTTQNFHLPRDLGILLLFFH